jgi:hypothetical protein
MRSKILAPIFVATFLLSPISQAYSSNLPTGVQKVRSLPSCGISRILNSKVSSDLTRSLTKIASKYYQAKHLLPIKVNAVNEVNLSLNYIGEYRCSNGVGAPQGSWGGSVPRNAKAAWLLAITHKMNEFGNFHFIYIAQIKSHFEVVGEGTGP